MGIRKKKFPAQKKSPAEFGAALAQARQDADHIFKQASEDEKLSATNSTPTTPTLITSPDRTTTTTSSEPNKVSPRSKAAAWAWYQRGGGNNPSANPEEVRNRAMVVMKRTSRFKAEALRVNGSYTADDTMVKGEQKWDPNQSLFDSFELLCVAKELDKALNEQHEHEQQQQQVPAPSHRRSASASSEPRHLVSLSCSSPSFMKRSSGGRNTRYTNTRKDISRLLSRFIPAPALCHSEADIATSTKAFKSEHNHSGNVDKVMMRRGNSLGSTAFGRISRLLSYSPSSKSQEGDVLVAEDEEGTLYHHRHEHFHHHHHHHHHHESF